MCVAERVHHRRRLHPRPRRSADGAAKVSKAGIARVSLSCSRPVGASCVGKLKLIVTVKTSSRAGLRGLKLLDAAARHKLTAKISVTANSGDHGHQDRDAHGLAPDEEDQEEEIARVAASAPNPPWSARAPP